MLIVCPNCSVKGSVELFLNDAASRKALQIALALPSSLDKRLLIYMGLFRPKTRAINWGRVEKLLSELLEPIKAGKLERSGRTFVVTVEVWQAALDALIAKRDDLRLPMKTHGLLFEITAGLADKKAARQERDKEQALKQRPRHDKPNPSDERDPNEAWKRSMKKYGREDLVNEVEQQRGQDRDD
ncbi:MAG: hypothetical protein KZQ94_22310 [Candidatus Thiodiazotropha sp. (ex Troendleina suluensis)]|nr:hypothetical protein [Candidatus Thiodiazotropha sp. (ex Troendleina suluensis)]